MRRLSIALISAISVIALTQIAAAAPPPPPVYNWTGWYAGVNAGVSFGRVKTDFNGTPIFASAGGAVQITPGFAESDISHPSGFIGGGQIGYNWQYSPLIVVGLEADIQGALEKETNNWSQGFSFFNQGVAASNGTVATNYTTQIDWFGTVRGRIGYVWGDGAVLTYVTGGLAYGEVKINGTNAISGVFGCCGGGATFILTQTFGHSQVNTGWVVGFGTEGKLLIPGWTYKIEALYMDLGTLNATSVTSGLACVLLCPPLTTQVTTHSHFTDGILRLGVNYQFH